MTTALVDAPRAVGGGSDDGIAAWTLLRDGYRHTWRAETCSSDASVTAWLALDGSGHNWAVLTLSELAELHLRQS